MATIHMVREHALGLAGAREAAHGWAQQVEDKLGMTCTREVGQEGESIRFTRTGVTGTLRVTPERFELDAQLGLLLGGFKARIETEITHYLDQLLAAGPQPGKKKRTG